MQHCEDPDTYPMDREWMAKEREWFEAAQKKDHLIVLPTEETSTYLDSKGRPKFDDRYVMKSQRQPPIGERHPKILAARKSGTLTKTLEEFYEHMSPKVTIPLAGNPSHPAFADRAESPEPSQGSSRGDSQSASRVASQADSDGTSPAKSPASSQGSSESTLAESEADFVRF